MVNLKNTPTGYPLPEKIKRVSNASNQFAKIFFLVLILVLLAGVIILATRVWDPFWNPFRPNPKVVLAKAFVESQKIKTAHTKVNLNFKMSDNGQADSMKALFESDYDVTNPLNVKSNTVFNVTVNPGENIVVGNLKVIGKDIYLKAKEINLPLTQSFLIGSNTDLSKIKNIWVDLSKAGDLSGVETANVINNSAIQEKIKQVFSSQIDIYDVKSQLADQVIDGQKAYHYAVAINNQKLADVLGELLKEGGVSTNAVIEASKKVAVDVLNNIGEINIDIYIGKKDNYIYKVAMDKSIGTASLSLEVDNSDFNQPVNVTVPADVVKIEQIYPEIKNSSVMTSLSYLKEDIIKLYSTEKTFKNISCDNANLAVDCNKIQKDLGAVVKINKSDKKYCAYVALFGDPTKYQCIDNTNTKVMGSITTSINPAKYGYCSGLSYKCPLPDK
jgi:hypothetical protein